MLTSPITSFLNPDISPRGRRTPTARMSAGSGPRTAYPCEISPTKHSPTTKYRPPSTGRSRTGASQPRRTQMTSPLFAARGTNPTELLAVLTSCRPMAQPLISLSIQSRVPSSISRSLEPFSLQCTRRITRLNTRQLRPGAIARFVAFGELVAQKRAGISIHQRRRCPGSPS